jgi:lipopolysaccharide/colanic/teichoic acid biosynthesis glycosyltransferase
MGLNPTAVTHTQVAEEGATRTDAPSPSTVTTVLAETPAKRALDMALSFVGIVLSSPLWFVTAAAIKMGDRGPVFYAQHRFGRGGEPFKLMKFRTMKKGSDTAGISSALVDDERVTSVGRILRATGIDELPQLWSILRGDMSLVGPRALAIGEAIRMADGRSVEFEEVPGFSERLAVKPGLTGPATIYLRKDADPLEKLEYDLAYIRDRSFWGDLRLILLSLWISVRGKWETRERKI